MNELQHVSLNVRFELPVQNGLHIDHIQERIQTALVAEFVGAWQDVQHPLRPTLSVVVQGFDHDIDSDEYVAATSLTRDDAHGYLHRTFDKDHKTAVEDYIDELEHQEGSSAGWAMFNTWKQLDFDFRLFGHHGGHGFDAPTE